ncbi:MAG: SMP-30/gluconolactonase/LRE family protein [Pseudonocardiaceae bacterium]
MPRKPAVRPVRWTPPPPAPHREALATLAVRRLPVGGIGPEDVLLDDVGGVFAGVEDGRILRVDLTSGEVATVADTGGRPLGLEWLPDGRILVCDAQRGLLAVEVTDDRDGRIETLVQQVDDAPMRLCNNAAVAPEGTIYFSDSSQRFGIEHHRADMLEHSGTGRLLRRAPDGEVDVLLDGLQFPNGVALDPSGEWLAVAETAGYRLLRLWLRGARAGQHEVLVDGLPGFPDNISTGSDGLIWVAIFAPRHRLLDLLLPRAPLLRRLVWALPEVLQPAEARALHVMAVDAAGTVVHDLRGPTTDYHAVTGVRERGGVLYLGSLTQQAIAVLDVP